MKLALAVITYDRAHYLSLVLRSISAQTIDGQPIHEFFDIHVFQDGLCSDDPRADEPSHRQVAEMMQNLPSQIRTYHQERNLGVALHFDFIEKLLFREKRYDFVLFCEDDLILSSQYVAIIKKMAEKFRGDARAGMISAHPANAMQPMEHQSSNLYEYAEIGHNWGFGLFRDFWERRQPFVELYLELIKAIPYRDRPHKLVYQWLEHCGFKPNASSQDYVKQCATVALGAARISTFPNFGLPIGRTGLHSKPELFSKLGFDRTVVCDRRIFVPGELTDAKFHEILNSQKAACLKNSDEFPSPVEWENLVLSEPLRPRRSADAEMPKIERSEAPGIISWLPSDIAEVPHMEEAGLGVLKDRLRESKCFLEYGAGGSTVLAAKLGLNAIYSVESDQCFLAAVKGAVAATESDVSLIDHYVDIGPTVEWGNPKDSTKAANWPLYASSIWNRILAEKSVQPDLVLIDGRFRVACFLATLHFAKPGTTILFDDYLDRPHYHVVEKYLKPVSRFGRMAEFRTVNAPPPEAMADLMAYSTTFA